MYHLSISCKPEKEGFESDAKSLEIWTPEDGTEEYSQIINIEKD